MSDTAPQYSKRGFTLIELLVVISIIAILSVIGIVVFTKVQNSARSSKLGADFDTLYKNIEQARMLQQKTLKQLTGSGCSECLPGGCRGQDAKNCLSVMTASYANITSAPLPLDPWGRPYTWDENEGEDPPCRFDRIRSAGPNGIWNMGSDPWASVPNDDICYFVPLSGQLCAVGIRQTDTPCSYIWPQTGL